MRGRRARPVWPAVACALVWAALGTAFVGAVVAQGRLAGVERADLQLSPVAAGVYVAGALSAGGVGTVLVLRRSGHPVGWVFVALATALAAGLALDSYARYGAVARPGALPGADAAARLLEPWFLAYFLAIAIVLHLTPTGRPLSPRWGRAAVATAAAALVGYVGGVVSVRPGDPPFQGLDNPFAAPALGAVPGAAMDAGAMATAAGMLAAAATLVTRFRRATGADRQQLLWLALAVVPLPVALAATFAFRDAGNEAPLLLATGGWVVVIPVATGLCIARYRLFDVERIVSRTVTYLLLSGVVVLTYAAVVVLVGAATSGRAGHSTTAAVLGTLAAVSVASPARRAIQDGLDRRFNRRRFDALALIDRHLRAPTRGDTIEDALRAAVGGTTLEVAYPTDRPADRGADGGPGWVSGDGRVTEPAPDAVVARRDGAVVAALSFDPGEVDRALVEAAATAALPELDNARLRAAIALQLVEVDESRARIAAAQLAERRRIERDLHDGAQQRLLALAIELKVAQLNGDPTRLREAVAAGIGHAQAALAELRALANGLRPAVLADGGLAAALDDLAARAPMRVDATCPEARFSPDVEAAAWFVVCEAVANATKHAAPSSVAVGIVSDDGWLSVTVRDDGAGGADPTGAGLQGIRDRAEATGGTLTMESRPGAGTTVHARIPCAP